MIRKFKEVQIWGTVIVLEAFGNSQSELDNSFTSCELLLNEVDRIFSTYLPDSEIMNLRNSISTLDKSHDFLLEIWQLSESLKNLTNGAFDPWASPGGVDFSGIVKGWAADKCCEIFRQNKINDCLINAAGDISVRGTRFNNHERLPWKIGIRDPRSADKVLTEFELKDCAIATSGTYERAHIIDPYTKLIAIGSLSASVIGPSGAVCEALATALIVAGESGGALFKKPEFKDYFAWVIDRDGKQVWSTKKLSVLN